MPPIDVASLAAFVELFELARLAFRAEYDSGSTDPDGMPGYGGNDKGRRERETRHDEQSVSPSRWRRSRNFIRYFLQ